MRYMLLIYTNEQAREALSSEEGTRVVAGSADLRCSGPRFACSTPKAADLKDGGPRYLLCSQWPLW